MCSYSKFFVASSILVGFMSGVAQAASDYNMSESSLPTRTASSEGRFARRLMVEGALLNAGFEGGDNSRHNQPNGYSAGLLGDFIGTGLIVMEAGALYRQMGTTPQNGFGNNSFTANYISVPLSAKYYFTSQEFSSLYVKAGYMGSTLISNNTYYSSPTRQLGAQQWESAVLGGIGYKINLGSSTDILVEANYNRGLDSVFADSNVYRSDVSGALGFAMNL